MKFQSYIEEKEELTNVSRIIEAVHLIVSMRTSTKVDVQKSFAVVD